jgi:Family of unknown function (DUF5681)
MMRRYYRTRYRVGPRLENTGRKQDQMTFQPGKSGNPAGKPAGARNKTTLAVEALLDGEAEGLTRKAIELAKAGDMQALRLCLDRIAPARKDRLVQIQIPPLNSAADAVKASASIMAALSAGELTPGEAAELGKLVANYVTALSASDFEKRLAQLEAAAAA